MAAVFPHNFVYLAVAVLRRGRNGLLGYRLVFRDGRKAYLERTVPNAMALADQLRSM